MGFFRTTIRTFFPSITMLFLSLAVHASPELITFQSRIVKPTGQALEASSVNFRLSLTDSVGSCVLFQEDFLGRNMTGTKGLVTLTMGSGSKVFPVGPMTMPEVFNNFSSPSFNCQAGGSIVAGPTDRRKLIMQFNDGSGWQTVPAVDINASPYAMQALAAQRLGSYPANDYLRTAQLPTCAGGQSLTFNGTSIVCVASGGGSGTVTNVTSANSYLSVATGTTTPTLTLNVGTGTNTVAAGDDSRITGAAQRSANLSDLANTTTARSNLGLGTAATLNAGTGINNLVQLDGSSRLPAVDGSLLTGVVATGVADNSITSAKINNGEIVNDDISASAAIARTKIAVGSPGHVVINDSGTGALSSLTCGVGAVLKFDASGFAICGTDNAGAGDIINGGNTGAVTIGTNDAQSLNLETSGSPRLTILSNGNVGVGTISPSESLDVVGGIRAGSSPTAMTVGLAMDSTQTSFINVNSSAGFPVSGALLVDNEVMTYTSRTANTFNNLTRGAYGTVAAAHSSGAVVQNYLMILSSTPTTPRMVVTSNGNVGIGIPAPTEKLSVLGKILIDGGNNNKTANLSVDQSLSLLRLQQNDNGATTEFDLAANNYAALRFNGTERFKVTNAGNVGIGIPTPLRLLHVAGPMRINPSTVPGSPAAGDLYVDSADNNILKFYDGSSWISAGSGGGGGVTTVSSANSFLTVTNGSSTPTLTVNVGTSTNTVAAGDDSRITGAAQKSANLSDLANAATARGNLGLGTAAVLNVGTGNNEIVQLNASAQLPAVDGSLLTGLTAGQIPNLDAAKITSGTIAGARLPALTGDVTMSAGTTTTDITGLARSKLANGSSNHVLINDGSGVMSSEATLAVSRGGTGLSSYTNNALIMANGTGTALTNATCSVGEILMWNATTWACTNMAASTQGYFKDGGNTFTGTATIGTNSNHNLAFETNGTTKMTVLATGNVGIGTTSPSSLLGISANTNSFNGVVAENVNSGNLASANLMVTNNSGVSGGLIAPSSGYVDPNMASRFLLHANNPSPGLDLLAASAAGNIRFFTGGNASTNERMQITAAGNVGIGTTSPQRLLHAAGPIRLDPAALPGTPAAGDIAIDSGDSNKLKWHDGTSWQVIGTGGGSVTNVTSANAYLSVATGSTTPALTLNVGTSTNTVAAGDDSRFAAAAQRSANLSDLANVGTARSNLGLGSAAILNVGTGNNEIVQLNASAQLPAVDGSLLTGLTAGQIPNLDAAKITSGTIAGARLPALTGDVTMSAGTTTTEIAGLARSKLAAGSNNHVLINDGSGVMSSEATLAVSRGGTGAGSFAANQIVGTNGTGSALTSFTCALNQVIKFDVTGNAVCGTDNSGGTGDILQNGNSFAGAMTIGTNDSNALNFETDGTTKMTVLANGNVGVGTTAPGALLQVGNPTTSLGTLRLAGNTSGYVQIQPAAAAGSWNMTLPADDGTPGQVLSTDGSGVTSWISAATNGGTFLATDGTDAAPSLSFSSAPNLGFYNRGSGRLGFSSGGNLEFTMSSTDLYSGLIGGPNISLDAGTNGAPVYSFRGDDDTGMLTPAADNLSFSTAGTEKMRIDSAGNVGIGTTSPQRLLHAAGPIRLDPAALPGTPAAGDIAIDSGDSNKLKWHDGTSWQVIGTGGGSVTNVTSANAYLSVATGSTTPALTLNVGTTTNTVAAGDDSRITGAAQKSANLSDLANAATARGNLGLGTAAVLNVGTGNNEIVQLNASAQLPAVDGSLLTGLTAGQIPNLDAAKITSGTIAGARLPALTGDVTMSAGTTTTDITGLARSKLANGSNNHVLINSGAGVMTSEAQLAISRGGTGLSSYTNNALIMANGTGTALTNATCSVGEILMWNATTWACTNMAASTQGYFKDGGNTFTGTAIIGTNSNHDLAFETNGTTKMTVLATGEVGIGTTGPNSALEVNGDLTLSAGSTRTIRIFQNAAGSGDDLMIKSGQGMGAGANGGNIIIEPSLGSFGGGKSGDTVIKGGFGAGGALAGNISITAGTGIGSSGGNVLIDAGGGSSNGMILLGTVNSGNVGIGTAAPGDTLSLERANDSTALSIVNTNSSVARYPGLYVTNYMGTANAGFPLLDFYNFRGNSGAPTPVQNNDTLLAIQASGAAVSGVNLAARISVVATENFSNSAGGGKILFQTTPNGTTAYQDRMVIDNDGFVGLGTSDPSAMLDVSSGNNISMLIGAQANSTTRNDTTIKVARIGIPHYTNAEEPLTMIMGSAGILNNEIYLGGGSTQMNTATQLRFYTAANKTTLLGTERMTIESNGNVGVGTNDPQTKLDVRGTASAETITEGSSTYVNSGASYTIPDATLSVRRIDLTANTTLTLPAYTSSVARVYTLTIFLRQDATGSRTVTWAGAGNTIKWDGGVAPTISANANKITIVQLTKVSDEAVWYGSMVWKED